MLLCRIKRNLGRNARKPSFYYYATRESVVAVKYQKLQLKLLLRDRIVRTVQFLYHGLCFFLGRLLLLSGRSKYLFPSTTKKVHDKMQLSNSTRPCPGDVTCFHVVYGVSAWNLHVFLSIYACYRRLSERQKCKGMGCLNLADCRPAKLTDTLPCQPIAV